MRTASKKTRDELINDWRASGTRKCPACGVDGATPSTGRDRHVTFNHGGSVAVQWSDGLGYAQTGPACFLVPVDANVCDVAECLEAPQNQAVSKCCHHLIEARHPRCTDCGEYGETRGHMTCMYPSHV